jgi:regulator of cell morphogenesis and NO signaling
MKISEETTVRDIASEHPSSVRIFEKAGVDYCCGGARSLHSVCESQNLDYDELLARLEAASAEAHSGTPGDQDWNCASLAELTKHIVERHHAYVREEAPRLEALIHRVCLRHGDTRPELASVKASFEELSAEMSSHMLKEEQVLFPYIERMESAAQVGKKAPPAFFGTVKNPVRAMMNEHDAAGELMKKIRLLTGNYTPPENACPTFRSTLSGLEEFERDLHQHIHLENNILFPRAVKMEEPTQD